MNNESVHPKALLNIELPESVMQKLAEIAFERGFDGIEEYLNWLIHSDVQGILLPREFGIDENSQIDVFMELSNIIADTLGGGELAAEDRNETPGEIPTLNQASKAKSLKTNSPKNGDTKESGATKKLKDKKLIKFKN